MSPLYWPSCFTLSGCFPFGLISLVCLEVVIRRPVGPMVQETSGKDRILGVVCNAPISFPLEECIMDNCVVCKCGVCYVCGGRQPVLLIISALCMSCWWMLCESWIGHEPTKKYVMIGLLLGAWPFCCVKGGNPWVVLESGCSVNVECVLSIFLGRDSHGTSCLECLSMEF